MRFSTALMLGAWVYVFSHAVTGHTQVILDNGDPGTSFVGSWRVSSGDNPYGTESLYSGKTEPGASYTYAVTLPAAGDYEVSLWWTQLRSRETDAPVEITHAGGSSVVTVDQSRDGGQWNVVGTWSFGATATVTIEGLGEGQSTCADALRFVSVGPPNTPPAAFIDSVSPSPAQEGEIVTFLGSGTDVDPDSSISEYEWTSDIDGALSTVFEFSTPLSAATHSISLRVRDDAGAWSEAVSVTLIVNALPNTPPTAVINNVSPNPAFEGQQVTGAGSGTDLDGNIVAYQWSSDRDGVLSLVDTFSSAILSAGSHTLSFIVQDNDGDWSSPATVQLQIDLNLPPTANIIGITEVSDILTFTGSSDDADGTVIVHEWTSDRDGLLSSQESFDLASAALSTGSHTISFRVLDDLGAWSATATSSLEVELPPGPSESIEVILDNGEPGTSSIGSWRPSSAANPYGTESLYAAKYAVGDTYTYDLALPGPGDFEVFIWWTVLRSRDTAAPFEVNHADGTATISVDQTADGGQWNSIGSWTFGSTASVTIRSRGIGLSTCADAVRVVGSSAGDSNTSPTATIDSVSPNPSQFGDTVSFSGSGTDSDGNIVAYRWRSTLDGEFSTAASFTTSSLSIGSHTIIFSVQDDDGEWSPEVSATLAVEVVPNQPPTAFISTLSPNPATEGDTVTGMGTWDDPDGSVVGFRWRSSIDGDVSSSSTLSITSLSVGTHTMFFSVQDDSGDWSAEDSSPLQIDRLPDADDAIIDNGEPGTYVTGTWQSDSATDAYGGDYALARRQDVGGTYTYDFSLTQSGEFEVFLWWSQASNRSTSVAVDVQHALSTATVTVDQTANGGQWNSIGSWVFGSDASVTVHASGDGSTSADAVRMARVISPPVVSISDATVTEGDSGVTDATFSVTLDPVCPISVELGYDTFSGSATAGSDFVADSGTVTFAPGESTRTISITVLGDTEDEPDEDFAVTLRDPFHAVLGDATASGTILDDDVPIPLPSISIADAAITEGDSGQTNATFVLTLSSAGSLAIDVSYATRDVTASAAEDYAAEVGTATFSPGMTSLSIGVGVSGDTDVEPDEIFELTLTDPVNAVISDPVGVATITDDDLESPILDPIGDRAATTGETISFVVSSNDPDGGIAILSSSPLPVGATFTDNTDGTGSFHWVTSQVDAGSHTVTFTASDEFDTSLTDSETITISIAAISTANFTRGVEIAKRFGIHEVALTGDGSVSNPFDTDATVTFTPPSGPAGAVTARAFHDGGNAWKARVYISEVGTWTWSSSSTDDAGLDSVSGSFVSEASALRGMLRSHSSNERQWMTDDGRTFLNLSDTAYTLFSQDVPNQTFEEYVFDDVSLGVTVLRAGGCGGYSGWSPSSLTADDRYERSNWCWDDFDKERFDLSRFQMTDSRLEYLLNTYPDLYVQLILFGKRSSVGVRWFEIPQSTRTKSLDYMLARWAAWPQVFFLILNDGNFEGYPRNVDMIREIGPYLAANDPWSHLLSAGPKRREPNPFITSTDLNTWHSYIHEERYSEIDALIVDDYAPINRHLYYGEDWYEQTGLGPIDPLNPAYYYRRIFWATILSGGSPNYGGRYPVIHPYTRTGSIPFPFDNMNYTAQLHGLDSAPFIAPFFEGRSIDIADFAADDAAARDPSPPSPEGDSGPSRLQVSRRGNDDFVIYLPNAEDGERSGGDEFSFEAESRLRAALDATRTPQAEVDLRGALQATFEVYWYRPTDGIGAAGGTVTGGDWVLLTSPWNGVDAVLHLRRVSG